MIDSYKEFMYNGINYNEEVTHMDDSPEHLQNLTIKHKRKQLVQAQRNSTLLDHLGHNIPCDRVVMSFFVVTKDRGGNDVV